MNYKSQLNGWAIEMAIKARDAKVTVEEVLEDTKKLIEYAYTPRKDFEDHMADFFEMVRQAPPGEANINALIGTLEHIQNDRYAQRIDIIPAETKGEVAQ